MSFLAFARDAARKVNAFAVLEASLMVGGSYGVHELACG